MIETKMMKHNLEQTICRPLLRCNVNNNSRIINIKISQHNNQTDSSRTNKIAEGASRLSVGKVSALEETECELVISLVIV